MSENKKGLPPLPEGWVWTILGEVGSVNLGKTPRKSQYSNQSKNKIVKFRDIVESKIDWTGSDKGFVIDSDDVIRQLSQLKKGDVLVTASAHASEHIGKKIAHVSEIPNEFKNVFFVGELLCVRVNGNYIHPKIIYYYLLSQDGYKSIQSHVRGVHLITSEAKQISFPLPPLPEQHRIVAKIEELFTRLGAGVAALKRAQAQLKRYRQSVLKAAVEGELTKGWREVHRGELEPASVLLARILKERRERWEAEQLAAMKAKGKPPEDDRWKAKYKDPAPPDTRGLPELPEGWVWATVENVCQIISGFAFKSKNFCSKGVPAVKIANISYGKFLWKDQEYLPAEFIFKFLEYQVWPDILLIALTRPITNNTVKVCLYPPDAPVGLLN